MLTIGEFAKASGLTARALRLYDELALLTPAEVDPGNGYRYYAPEQVDRARLVARLRSAGVPLPRIASIIDASTPGAAADEVLSYWRQVETDRASARKVIASLVALLREQDNTMNPSTAPDPRIADLIAGLHAELPDADDLARISAARHRAQALTDLGDQLVDHFVSQAKLGGASWDEISGALGEPRDGAEPRRSENSFERFTDLTRHSIVLAQEAAREHRHDLIGSAHLLLGLLGEPRGLAYEVLMAKAQSEQAVRDAIDKTMPPAGKEKREGHIAFSPDSKTAITAALRASSDLGHDWVGTEHLLLGLMHTEESRAAHILLDLGFTTDSLGVIVTTRLPHGQRPHVG